jgi:site-specific DNA recombinase
MRAGIYARVSTEDQEREGTSLGSQVEACLNKARGLGYETPQELIFIETFSGLTLNRPGLAELREKARDRDVEAVIVHTPDRLSRVGEDILSLAKELRMDGVKLLFVNEQWEDTLNGKLVGFMLGWASEFEAAQIRERTMRGKLAKAKQGKQPCGKAAYGYRLRDGEHEINEEEAEVIRMVFDWLARDGMTLRAIQLRLNRLGIPTKEDKSWWQRATLYRIVRDPIYTGKWYYNKRMEAPAKTKKGATVQVLKPREQWIPVEVPAIISEQTFEAAQRQLERNRELCKRNTKREYLLTGLLVCGKCGFNLNARTVKARVYYCCNSKLGTITPNICPSKYIQGPKLEEVVWDTISRLLAQPELFLQQLQDRKYNPVAHIEANLGRVCQSLERKTVEADRMLDAYKIGAINIQTLKCKLDEIKKEQAELNNAKLSLETDIRNAQAEELNEEKLYRFCRGLPATLTNLNFEDRKQILREVVDKVVVDGNKVTIYGIIPKPEGEVADVSVGLSSS